MHKRYWFLFEVESKKHCSSQMFHYKSNKKRFYQMGSTSFAMLLLQLLELGYMEIHSSLLSHLKA
jgi:hypothetical protein